MSGLLKLVEILPQTKIESLKCESLKSFGSVDGPALQIDELRGTKPTEKIDLSNKFIGFTSAIIIASCIKGNGVLKELKCAAAPRVFPFVPAPIDTYLLSHCPPPNPRAVSTGTSSGPRAPPRSLLFSRRRRSPI